ncbi:hypothetical protein [Natrinema longum]|uniref:Uncharacterized protein n=1 Tax=Natrinema longum TaxID=370324 RepID=A0A8A2UBI7_9EURY|nr:hypothetical protein [Natrinema longum]MBZ6496014.1 hypothetical protein [Natrinema longum]QSW86056.1 hypothetical protein J0X27_04270 [Natrinema longum]
MTDDSIQDIEAEHGQPSDHSGPTPSVDPGPSTDGDGSASSGFSLGPSKRTLVILGVVTVALAALYWLRTRQQDGDDDGAEESSGTANDFDFDTLEDSDDADDDDEETLGEIVVPQDPNEPLKGDRAVIQGLKDRGKISGAGS